MKLWHPDHLHIFKGPYITDPTNPLPYRINSFARPALTSSDPHFRVSLIERKLFEMPRFDEKEKWMELCTLLCWDPKDPALVVELDRIKTEFMAPAQAGKLPSHSLHPQTNQLHSQ
jgi:hypothetical protein